MKSVERKFRVFLCHASQDKTIVRELYKRLLHEGWIDPWLDEEKLLPGQDWDLEIEREVEAAEVVIVFLSNDSVTKEGYVQRELKFVLDIALEKPDGTIFVIPLRLEDCQVPRRLKSWHYVDCFPVDRREISYRRILQALNIRNENIGKNQEITFPKGIDSVEAARKEKMSIQGELYDKGYTDETAGPTTEEIPILFANNNKHDLTNYADYLLIDEKKKLNELIAIKSRKFILEDPYDKSSLQSKLIESLSPWIRFSLPMLCILIPVTFSIIFKEYFGSNPSFLWTLILLLLIGIPLLGVGYLYRKLIDSNLKYEIQQQEERIRKLIG